MTEISAATDMPVSAPEPQASGAAVEAMPAMPPAEPAGLRRFPAAGEDQIREAFESGRYPYARPMGTRPYEAEKLKLQAELLKVQIWAQETGQKFVILMEGRDAAGKGGTIKRFMEHLNPRYARTRRPDQAFGRGKGAVVLSALHRASAHGGRNGVLRPLLVQSRRGRTCHGLLHAGRIPEFMRQAPEFERMLVRSGIGFTSTGSRSRAMNSVAASSRARPIR